MSSAAPAAAASAATPAAPAAEGASTPQAPASAQPTETLKPRPIKPIPPPRLPGVMEDGPENATTRPRERDSQGRFAGSTGGETVAKPEPRSVDASDLVPEPPEAKPKYKFAGREYDSQEAAEQYFRSMEGRHRPIQQKATEYESKLIKAAESARGWNAEALRLQARVAELEAAQGKPAEPAAEQRGIDWALYAEIAKVANEAGEPWKAQQWLQEQVDAARAADLAALREELSAPYREAEAAAAEQAELSQSADAIVDSMSAHKNPDGSPAFPEFADPTQARAVGELWSSLGLDPRMALTPGGAVAAIAVYRLARAMEGAPAASAVPAPPVPNPAAAAAAGLEGGRPLLPAASGRREMDPSTARLIAGLKNTQLIRPGLGFEA
jgi:hypothetical protein